jgi:hypothetical protein
MVSWPPLGTRVTVRYRRPPGSVPPLTDAIGRLLAFDPLVRVQTKEGAIVECAPTDVVALRALTDAPVRTSEIRALEHAAASVTLAWPGIERTWLNGWLLRAGHPSSQVNIAVPLDISARVDEIPAILAWYGLRNLTPRLLIPDRLLRPPPGLDCDHIETVLVRPLESHAGVTLDDGGHASVTVGEFARATVTDAPDGTRWLGLWDLRAADGAISDLSDLEALLAWGSRRGAARGYLRVGHDEPGASALAERLGFRLHHRNRYFLARADGWDTV